MSEAGVNLKPTVNSVNYTRLVSRGHWGQTCLSTTTSCTQTKQNQQTADDNSFQRPVGFSVFYSAPWAHYTHWQMALLLMWYKRVDPPATACEPVWPSSKAGKQKGLGSIPLQLSFLTKKVVVCGQCLVTLSITINETLKWFSSLPILMQESFGWRQCSDRYITSLPLSLPPFAHP